MKKFEMPKVEIEKFEVMDVITASFECIDDNTLPCLAD